MESVFERIGQMREIPNRLLETRKVGAVSLGFVPQELHHLDDQILLILCELAGNVEEVVFVLVQEVDVLVVLVAGKQQGSVNPPFLLQKF